MKTKLSPSMLSIDFGKVAEQLKLVEDAGTQYIHLDVMDGIFVPNISFGIPVIKSIRKHSNMVFDAHLMIVEPEKYVEEFRKAGADIIMLDNMSDEDMRKAVTLIAGRAKTECSGNVTRENIARLRDIGIDYVSSGALTHSAPILDLSMKHLRPLTAEEA